MTRSYLCALLILVLLGCVACVQPVSGEIIKSDRERVSTPDVSQTDLTTFVAGNGEFAFDLYQALRNKEGNLFYSPHSISLALAMTYAGARGDTEQQIADTLRFTLPDSQLHRAFNWLDIELSQRGEGAKGKDGKGFQLNIINAIWGQKDYKFLSAFLDILAENYGAGLRPLDFITAPEQSRITINDWVSEQTEGKIKDLIPQGLIHALTRLVLTNAIYFNAAWQYPFEEELTRDGPFYLLDGSMVTVPMMRQTENFGYTEGEGYQAVELPYDGRELSMVIMLPRTDNFKSFEGSLDYLRVDSLIKAIDYRRVNLTMPKFEFESELGLGNTLSAMGMPIAFSASADFSGMTDNRELFIQEVIHKAFVSVDEAGTEAAAATAVIMPGSMVPGEPVEVTIERPFIFLIRDIEAGAILFIGRVADPAT